MRNFILLFSLLFLPLLLQATHNRAGEIIVRSAADCSFANQNTACATIITYTEIAQAEVDRDSLKLSWGDGAPPEYITRTNKFSIGNGIQRNEYRMCHVYPGAGSYFISFQDQNRVANVLNIINSPSVGISFSVYTVYTVTSPLQGPCNNSPELTQIPIENACVGSVWTHNPGAFDVDGDSLAYEFTSAQSGPNVPIPDYVLPNEYRGPTGSLIINERTGQITWNAPAVSGEYNLAFLIKSFRNGQPLDTVVRDMQIFVSECNNDPPTLDIPFEEICVVAGDILEFDVIAGAPVTDVEQLVRLEASGRPFDLLDNPAAFQPNDATYNEDPFVRTFRWRPDCSQISDQPYIVVFRAEDDFFQRFSVGDQLGGLATLKAVSIKVVAPPPLGLTTLVEDESITLSWDKPYFCEGQPDPEFEGFNVYRRIGSNPFVVDTCVTGLAGEGYTRLTDPVTMEMVDGRYVFLDQDIQPGRTYCYRVVAQFGKVIANTNFFSGRLESLASEEICVQLARNIPLLTKVDVITTDPGSGEIDVCWILPDANALDTLVNGGPYRYVLSRAEGQTNDLSAFSEVITFTREFFAQEVDTCFTDTGLNTDGVAYSYLIELFVEDRDTPFGEGQPGSSVRLGGAPTDDANDLNWTALVPWTNVSYFVLRRAPGETDFTVIDSTDQQNYRDDGLQNGEEYCYLIEAVGTYNVDGLPSPLLNTSQEICLTPIDNVPPCPPVLSIISPCERGADCTDQGSLFNTLTWMPGSGSCGTDDVAGYRIYFSKTPDGSFVEIAEVQQADLLTYDDFPTDGITGCYRITAFDLNGNESAPSEVICVTNCPIYELPNAFTPNGDGQNEAFVPISRCFIERVEFQIFNRWGQLVFETEDPALNWDGTNPGGDVLASGTYYYVGIVFEQRLEGVMPSAEPVSGYIELVRGE
ncbi:T9SS type B sorting domain-containing protein [Neolewinella antarctica]|uniref:Gliding motility-associated-like protein n=1 Tax=Neolewinella antarctica TaxID=442734 RepID=A0ABX0XD83_9BACT|nr:gliding motility-associated C-terminal domain-containing protein [Neolewinella antarctica]NJC26849.1 gliding motility-associated-like protein [Neolewinella antarctica]